MQDVSSKHPREQVPRYGVRGMEGRWEEGAKRVREAHKGS